MTHCKAVFQSRAMKKQLITQQGSGMMEQSYVGGPTTPSGLKTHPSISFVSHRVGLRRCAPLDT